MSAFFRLFDALRFAATASLVACSLSSVAFGSVLNFTDYAAWSAQPEVTVSGTENFEGFNGFYETVTGTVGGVVWNAGATGGVFADGIGGSQAMSTNIPASLTFSYDPAASVMGVGGTILATDDTFSFLAGEMSVLVTLADTTTQTFTRSITSPNEFWGFQSTDLAISSITISAGSGYLQDAYPTIDRMVVAVPEPSTLAMGAAGIACAAIAACRRRAKSA